MTPPMPPGLVRTHRNPAPSRLERWRDAEPVRLYAYTVLAALLVVLTAVGLTTGELAHALTGMVAAVLGVIPAAELGRASVWSPATVRDRRTSDADRFAAIVARDAA
jgi:hypothetical protein